MSEVQPAEDRLDEIVGLPSVDQLAHLVEEAEKESGKIGSTPVQIVKDMYAIVLSKPDYLNPRFNPLGQRSPGADLEHRMLALRHRDVELVYYKWPEIRERIYRGIENYYEQGDSISQEITHAESLKNLMDAWADVSVFFPKLIPGHDAERRKINEIRGNMAASLKNIRGKIHEILYPNTFT